MSKKLFTNEEIRLLSKNKYIKNITPKGVILKWFFRSVVA